MLHTLNPEVVMLQETHLKPRGNTVLNDKTFPYQLHATGSSKARGTTILIKGSVQFQELAVQRDKDGRFLAVKGLINGEKVTLASIYAPNTSQLSFLEEVFQKRMDFGEGQIVAAGDFNYIVDLRMDRSYKPNLANVFQSSAFTRLKGL